MGTTKLLLNIKNLNYTTHLTMLNLPTLTLYRTVMPIGTPFLKEKINN